MKANELRLYNWIKMDGNLICVNGQDMIGILKNGYEIYPILLTEEWLLKFGFQFRFIINGDYRIKQWYFEDFTLCSFNYYYNLQINYIHQLQNLFFAIKGKELIYNNGDNKENIQMD